MSHHKKSYRFIVTHSHGSFTKHLTQFDPVFRFSGFSWLVFTISFHGFKVPVYYGVIHPVCLLSARHGLTWFDSVFRFLTVCFAVPWFHSMVSVCQSYSLPWYGVAQAHDLSPHGSFSGCLLRFGPVWFGFQVPGTQQCEQSAM